MIELKIKKAKNCNGEYAMFISFPYNQKIVDTIRDFPTRYWDKDRKEWEMPLNKMGELTEKLSDFDFNISGTYVMLDKPTAKIPEGFEFKTQPFEHQIDGFNYGLKYDRWLLGDEQGLGKTKQVIDIAVAKKLQYGYKHCLIVCGVNGLKWNWLNEIHTHSNEQGYILGQKIKKGKIVIGSTKDKAEDVKHLSEISDYFLITNVETLRNEETAKLIADACDKGEIGLVAIDEIHKCKDPSSQQGKGILKLKPECRIAMTGTPLMNQPMDLYIILKWLGYEKHAFYAFKKHYCVMGGYGGYEVIGYKNLDELREQLDSIMLRRLKDDVLDLPEKTYIDEYVEMTAKQATIYKEVTAEIQSNIDMIKTAPNPLAQLIRMRQATGYTGILSSTIKESAKIDRMVELVDEAVANGKKVVIFSNWTQMTDIAYDRLLAKGFVGQMITGDTKDESRQLIVDAFQNSKYQDFIIGTIGAMGTGLNLFEGSVIIFVDHPWNRAMYDQAVDRCHRIGQKHNLTIYNLICKNTIDERIWELVNKKGRISDALVDGKLDMSNSELVNFLLS